jgi:hypothetical protein
MKMVIRLNGRITDTGELEMDLPSGLPSGEARITIEIPAESRPDSVGEALRIEPMTGAEIVRAGLLGGWKDEGITDGAAWVEEVRRKRRENRQW